MWSEIHCSPTLPYRPRFDCSHNILHETEAAPRLPGTPIARDLPLSRKPIHTTPVDDGATRWPGINGSAARDFSIARKGGDEFWDEGILLVPEAKTAVTCTTPDENIPAITGKYGFWSGPRPAMERKGRDGTHPFESTARLCCGPAEIWTIFRSFRPFTTANRGRVGHKIFIIKEATYSACLQSRTLFFHS